MQSSGTGSEEGATGWLVLQYERKKQAANHKHDDGHGWSDAGEEAEGKDD